MSQHESSNVPSIYNTNCPSRHLLNRVADKWAVMLMGALEQQGPQRFGALKRLCAGISQKMLTQTLRNLERDGLIRRTVLTEKPLQVEYALTDMGGSLVALMQPLIDWVHTHYQAIELVQTAYDGHDQ